MHKAKHAEVAATVTHVPSLAGPKQRVLTKESISRPTRSAILCRYRNFRTFTTPEAVQLVCVAIEGSGEVVCAGSRDTFQVFLWNMRTGQLLDALSGHEGPVSALAFNPSTPPKKCRMWLLLSGHHLTVLAQTRPLYSLGSLRPSQCPHN